MVLLNGLVYWAIGLLCVLAAWLQWFLNVTFWVSAVSWLGVMLLSLFLLSRASIWPGMLDYLAKAFEEAGKVYWVSWQETRSVALSVSLMIAVFSVILWGIDRVVIWLLMLWM